MNKKILLLMAICIFSVLTLTVSAGDTACGLGGCNAASVAAATGTATTIPLFLETYTVANVTWLPHCGNSTANGSCFVLNSTFNHNITNVCNATNDVTCDPASVEYLNQVLNLTWYVPPFVSVKHTAVTVDNNGVPYFAALVPANFGLPTFLLIGKTNPNTGIITANMYANQSGMNIVPTTLKWDKLSDGTLLLGMAGQTFIFGGDMLGIALKVNSNAQITEEIGASANNTATNTTYLEIGTDDIGSHAVLGLTETTGTPRAYLLTLNTYPALMTFSSQGVRLDDIFFLGAGSGPIAHNGILPLDNTYTYSGTTRQAFNIYYSVKRTFNGGWDYRPTVYTLMPDRPYLRRNATVWTAAAFAPFSGDPWYVDSVAEVYGSGGRHVTASGRFREPPGPPPVLTNLTIMRTGPLAFSNAVQTGASAGVWTSGHQYTTVHPNNSTVKMCSPDGSHVYISHVDTSSNANIFVYGSVLNRLAWYQEQSGDAFETSWADCGGSAIIATNLGQNATALQSSRMFVLQHSNLVSAFNVINMTVNTIAVLNSEESAPHGDDHVDFVLGGLFPNSSVSGPLSVLDFINTSLSLSAVNPNGTTRFTTDKQVVIQTMHPDINILNFQLDFQAFNGTFDTTLGTCVNCSFDLGNGTCQAEVEKVWGMFQNYRLNMTLDTAASISMTNLTMECRTANATVTKNAACAGLFSTYGVGSDGCVSWLGVAGRSWVIGANGGVGIDMTNFTSASFGLGNITPTATCEQIACEVTGIWKPGDTQEFVMNKTITVTAI